MRHDKIKGNFIVLLLPLFLIKHCLLQVLSAAFGYPVVLARPAFLVQRVRGLFACNCSSVRMCYMHD